MLDYIRQTIILPIIPLNQPLIYQLPPELKHVSLNLNQILSVHLSLSRSLGVVAVSIVTEQGRIVEELLESLVAPLGIPTIDRLHVDWSLDGGVVVGGRRGREKLERQPKVLTERTLPENNKLHTTVNLEIFSL